MSNNLSDTVWHRRGKDTINGRLFSLLYGLFTLAGLSVTAFGAYLSQDFVFKGVMAWVMPISVLVLAILGIVIALYSDKPIVSLLGFMLVAVPFGVLLGPVVRLYDAAILFEVLGITMAMTVGLAFLGAAIPRNLASWGNWLFGGLIVLILGGFFVGFSPAWETVYNWLGIILFSAYIIFDVNRAKFVPKTVDNAIDCALALYLDIVNLFLFLLKSYAGSRD